MKPATLRSLALVFACVAVAAGRAEDRTPAPAPAAAPPTVALPTVPPAAMTTSAPPAAATAAPALAPSAGASVIPLTGDKSAPAQTKADSKASAPAAKSNTPPPLSPQFQRVRDHIKALYGIRDEPRPASDPRKNPFRPPVTASIETAPTPPRDAASAAMLPGGPVPAPADTTAPSVNSNLTLLKQAVAQLKINGTVEREGRMHLQVNQVLYREGDVIKVTVQGQTLLLRISKMTRTSLTLMLNDAEMTLKI
jgi:hypothetical protein